ncbi:MAG: HPr family phosphocarrier protein [Elusimicrobia bacterium]|nr:HPr family phosphocarrier protein [Elusimicrobiota bacterium]
MEDFIIKKYRIRLPAGIHVRTALTISKLAGNFASRIFISKGGEEVGIDSPLGILALGIEEGDEIEVKFVGPDKEKLSEEFDKLVEDNFGE